MKLIDINPHIRFAEQITYVAKNTHVYVKDCRIFYIVTGKGNIHINNNYYNLKENTLFYCCAGSDYIIKADEPIKLYSLNFDLTQSHSDLQVAFTPVFFNNTKKCSPVDSTHIEDSNLLNTFFVYENAYAFKDMIENITKEFSLNGLYFREYSGSLLKSFLINLHKINITNQNLIPEALQKTIEYINSNFNKEIKNSTLSKIAGYHEFYLNRLFNIYIGTSMHKYILTLRLNESKYRLLNSNMTISEIAEKSGFNSNTHFSTMFKKEFFMTPFEYRRKFKNNI